jgi:hypothetical protein
MKEILLPSVFGELSGVKDILFQKKFINFLRKFIILDSLTGEKKERMSNNNVRIEPMNNDLIE